MARELKAKITIDADTKAAERNLKKLGDTSKKSFKDVEKSGDAATKGVGRLSSGFSSLALKVTGAAVVISGFVRGLGAAISASAEQEAAIAKLDASLASLGDSANAVSKALQAQAAELQLLTKFGDEETIAAQALIAAFVKEEDQIKTLTRVTQDFAEAKGVSLASAADLITKTFASSTNALTRYGIEVEGAANSTERLESLTKGLDAAFKGAAQAGAKTYAGQVKQLSNAFGDLLEVFGDIITTSTKVLSAFSFLTEAFRRAGNLLTSITGSVGFTDQALDSLAESTEKARIAAEAESRALEVQTQKMNEASASAARVAEAELKLLRSTEPLILIQDRLTSEFISGAASLDEISVSTLNQAAASEILRSATEELISVDRRRTEEAVANSGRRQAALGAENAITGDRSEFNQLSGGQFTINEQTQTGTNGRVSFIGVGPSLRGISASG